MLTISGSKIYTYTYKKRKGLLQDIAHSFRTIQWLRGVKQDVVARFTPDEPLRFYCESVIINLLSRFVSLVQLHKTCRSG